MGAFHDNNTLASSWQTELDESWKNLKRWGLDINADIYESRKEALAFVASWEPETVIEMCLPNGAQIFQTATKQRAVLLGLIRTGISGPVWLIRVFYAVNKILMSAFCNCSLNISDNTEPSCKVYSEWRKL